MKKVLQLTVHFFPNVGGVETHLIDLLDSLVKRNWKVFVITYQPLSTKTKWKIYEKEKILYILRIPWIRGFFEKLVYYPIFEFIYLVPGLFLVTPFIIIFFKPNVLHAHGLSAAVSAVFWGKIFRIRTVISLHSLYTFPKKGLYYDFIRLIFKNSDFILSLSKKSNKEVKMLGINENKTGIFTYWIDLNKFRKIPDANRKLGWEEKFVCLYVGRLVLGKGVEQLLEAALFWNKKIQLMIIGSGPMQNQITEFIRKSTNIHFLGRIDQNDLPLFYSAADLVIVPSTSEEGFGRVVIESLACQTPVIASKKGAIKEAMDETVGQFIEPTSQHIKEAVEYFYNHPEIVLKFSKSARNFVEKRYSEKNVNTIIKAYNG